MVYGAEVIAKNGRLSTSCYRAPEDSEDRDVSARYRLAILAYDDTTVDDGYTQHLMAYDAMRLLVGEPPIFFSADAHYASYARVQQSAEQYRAVSAAQ